MILLNQAIYPPSFVVTHYKLDMNIWTKSIFTVTLESPVCPKQRHEETSQQESFRKVAWRRVFLGQLKAELIWAACIESSSQESVVTGPAWIQNKVFHQRSARLWYPLLFPLFAWLCAYLPGFCNGITPSEGTTVILSVIQCFSKMVCLIPLNKFPTAKTQQTFVDRCFVVCLFQPLKKRGNHHLASTLVVRSQQIRERVAQCTVLCRSTKASHWLEKKRGSSLFYWGKGLYFNQRLTIPTH